MHASYFLTFTDSDTSARLSDADCVALAEVLAKTPALIRANIYTPAVASDIYTNDGAGPKLALQLDFPSLEALEAVIAREGYLQLLAHGAWPWLAACTVTQQAMMGRPFPVPEPLDAACNFVVHYPGAAENFGEWINYYLEHHPQIMYRFPDIREIEIHTRVDWLDAMPWPRVDYMQRNRVGFDSPEALTAALHSQVRHEMRADFEGFPAFTGGNVHYPMATRVVRSKGD